MKKKIIIVALLLIVVLVESLTLLHWLSRCIDFKDEMFHVNFNSMTLQIQGESAIDQGPIIITRVFHNKITDFALQIFKLYLRFWDVQFLGKLFSFAGFFGILAAGWYFFLSKTKRLWQWAALVILLLLPFMELFLFKTIPFPVRLGSYIFTFGIISLLGIGKFILSQKWAPVIVLILAIISLWWLLAGDFNFVNFCIQYPLR
jgi:hypothetical protein